MLGAMFLFSINDVMGKWLVATYGVTQIMLIRSLAAGIMQALDILWSVHRYNIKPLRKKHWDCSDKKVRPS